MRHGCLDCKQPPKPECEIAGRATDWVVTAPDSPGGAGFASRGFGISDVMLVGSVTPRPGATRWHDIDVEPTAGTIRFGGQLALVWENYELGVTDGAANYTVMIAVERRYRETLNRIRARVIGAFAAMAGVERTADRVIFRYDRSAPHAPVVLDHLTIGLDETPPGEYRLTLVVTDKSTGRSAERVQRFVIHN